MGIFEILAGLAAGAGAKWWSKKKGSKLHKVGSPLVAVVAGAAASQLGIHIPVELPQASPGLLELLSGGAGAVLVQSLFKGSQDSLKKD